MKPIARAIVLAAVLSGAMPASRGDELGSTVLAKGLFSYQAPMGWTVSENTASKFPVAIGPLGNGFAANLNVAIEKNSQSLDDYVAYNVESFHRSLVFRNLQVLDRQPFTTSAGLPGIRLVITDTIHGIDLHQTFYFFDGGSATKLVIAASCRASEGARDAAMFDASVKTFSLE